MRYALVALVLAGCTPALQFDLVLVLQRNGSIVRIDQRESRASPTPSRAQVQLKNDDQLDHYYK